MKNSRTPVLLLTLLIISHFAHSQLWKEYTDSAKVYQAQKNMDKAAELYSMGKEELMKDSASTNTYAGVCNELARLFWYLSKYEKAEPLFLEAREIRAKVLGKAHPDYAASCHNLGTLYSDMGQYKKAELLYLEGKEIREKSLGKKSVPYAESCNNLAGLYVDLGQYKKAEPLYLEAKKIKEKVLGKEDPNYGATCFNLAGLYQYMGAYDKAELLYLEDRHITEKVLGKDHPDYAGSCNNLAGLYWNMGQYGNAEKLYLEALQIAEKALGKEHPQYVRTSNNLAGLYFTMGQYEKAEPLYLEAKKIREKLVGKEHPDYATTCDNLGCLYADLGQYEKAESLHLEARQIREKTLGKDHERYAASCDNLAILYMYMGEYQKAEPLYLEARQINRKAFGNEHPNYAESCDNLALLYCAMGKYERAKPLYLEAMKIRKKAFGKAHPVYAESCDNLAVFFKDIGQYEKAEPLALEAKQILTTALGKEHVSFIASCNHLANLYWKLKKTEKANKLYAEAFASENSQLRKIFQFSSELEKQSYLKRITDLENYYLSFASTVYPYSKQALTYNVSLSRRNLILSSSIRLRQAMYASGDTGIQNKYNAWINLREQLSFWYTKPVTERPAYVAALNEKTNTLEKELTRVSSTFKEEQEQHVVNWKDIQQDLKPHEAAIEFVHFNYYNGRRMTDSTYYVALLLKKDVAEPALIPLFENRELNKLLGDGNTLNTIYTLYRSSDKPGLAYRLIWQPLEKQLKNVTKIYFAPSGLLHRISFGALPVGNGHVLSDKYALVQLNTTGSVAGQSNWSIDTSDKLFLYGGIEYDVDSVALKQAVVAYRSSSTEWRGFLNSELTRGSSWKYLPGTEKEINIVSTLAKQKNYSTEVAKGVLASEESIKSLYGTTSPAVLHIATHGFFFPDPKEEPKKDIGINPGSGNVFRRSDNPLFRAGLLFAGAGNAWNGRQVSGTEDGILTAYEVSNLYLPNTKLVVLSACETGLGDIQGNEGVYGLQRAFKMAGVENLVMSLWKVSDQATAEFMEKFYAGIFNKKSVSDAFYNAQTIMKNKYRKEPHKWAAWILIK